MAYVGFRVEGEVKKKLEEIARNKDIRPSEIYRLALKEYLGMYKVGAEPTVGRLQRRLELVEKRLEAIENLLLKRGADSVLST